MAYELRGGKLYNNNETLMSTRSWATPFKGTGDDREDRLGSSLGTAHASHTLCLQMTRALELKLVFLSLDPLAHFWAFYK